MGPTAPPAEQTPETPGTPARVVAWVEGTPLHVAGFRTLLASFAPAVEAVAVVGARHDLVTVADQWRPEVMVVHAHQAGCPLHDRIRRLRERAAPPRIVVIAHQFEIDSVDRLTSLGVNGVFAAASLSPERLRNALLVARCGDIIVDPAAVAAAAGSGAPSLTGRQCRILALVVDGRCDDAIARELAVSTSTVKRDLRRIYEALDTPNRAGAAAYAVQAGIVPAAPATRT